MAAYAHFRDKRELLAAVADAIMGRSNPHPEKPEA